MKCDHIYFPVYDKEGKAIGQQCSICPQYNSLEDIERMMKEPPQRKLKWYERSENWVLIAGGLVAIVTLIAKRI